jgi:tripartite-type tricarboxylate transporter receptor subunit TctC
VVERLAQGMDKVMKDPNVISQIEKAGMIVDYRDSDATFKLVEQEFAAVAKVVKKMGIGK